MWIGRATHYANRCPLEVLVPADPDVKHTYVRDSTGKQFRGARGRKRKAEGPAALSTTASPRMPAHQSADAGDARSAARGRGACRTSAVTPAAAVWYGDRAKRARLHQQLEAARSDAQLQKWLASRPRAAPTAVTPASERFEALRQRIVAKERRCTSAAT